MKTQREKHYVVNFTRTYEIPESKVKEYITRFCNVGETADDHQDNTEEYQELAEDAAQAIAENLLCKELPSGDELERDVRNFFFIEHSASMIVK